MNQWSEVNKIQLKPKIWAEGGVLLFLGLFFYVLFNWTNIDIFVAHFFYTPKESSSWAYQSFWLWDLFYKGAPIITGFFAVGALLILFLGLLYKGFKRRSIYAIFIFLTVVIGPGLIVNAILKPYWGRPRPRQIVEFSGPYQYQNAWHMGLSAQGKSFPCGHNSVGFLFLCFWFIHRRKKRWLAYLSLFAALSVGTLMGIGRMAAGAHFLSDVFWSGWIMFFVTYVLYYFVLRVPDKENIEIFKSKVFSHWLLKCVFIIVMALTLGALLLATPFYKTYEKTGKDSQIESLYMELNRVHVIFSYKEESEWKIFTTVRGFGWPGSFIRPEIQSNYKALELKLEQSGFFTDQEVMINIQLNDKINKVFIKGESVSFQKEQLPHHIDIQLTP